MSVQLLRSGTLAAVVKESGVEKHALFLPSIEVDSESFVSDSESLVSDSNSSVTMHMSTPLVVGRSITLACMMDALSPEPLSTTAWYDEPRTTSKKLPRLHAYGLCSSRPVFYLHVIWGRGQERKHNSMTILMQTAYWVHGTVAPLLPFEIPRDRKAQIRRCIERVENAADAALSYPGNMLMPDPCSAYHAEECSYKHKKPKSD